MTWYILFYHYKINALILIKHNSKNRKYYNIMNQRTLKSKLSDSRLLYLIIGLFLPVIALGIAFAHSYGIDDGYEMAISLLAISLFGALVSMSNTPVGSFMKWLFITIICMTICIALYSLDIVNTLIHTLPCFFIAIYGFVFYQSFVRKFEIEDYDKHTMLVDIMFNMLFGVPMRKFNRNPFSKKTKGVLW